MEHKEHTRKSVNMERNKYFSHLGNNWNETRLYLSSIVTGKMLSPLGIWLLSFFSDNMWEPSCTHLQTFRAMCTIQIENQVLKAWVLLVQP